MISLRNRLQQLSGSKPVLFNTLRYGTLGVLLLSGALLAQRPDSWEKERANAEAPTTKRSAEPAGNLGKPLDEVWRIVFHNSKGKDIVLDCEVARTEKEKERGLMFRKFLGKNRGMIFVYNQPDQMNFWMQNTLIPLSIAYVHEKLFIASIHDMKPLSLDIVSSDIPVLYAIEANVGWFKNNHILSGNRITIYKNPADYKVETKSKYRQEVPTP
ncbi:MAG TPA: DUF192 domain-containing protein [Turneriella sp.]|nr:DUF192 domain-containing protein [Turneriella sp.]